MKFCGACSFWYCYIQLAVFFFFNGLFTFYVQLSLLSFISIVSLSLHLSIPTGFQLLHTVLLGSNKKRAEKAIKIYQKTKKKKKHSIEKRR